MGGRGWVWKCVGGTFEARDYLKKFQHFVMDQEGWKLKSAGGGGYNDYYPLIRRK